MSDTLNLRKVQLLQHNCARSYEIMQSYLNSAYTNTDIVLIQKSWILRDQNITLSHSAFICILSQAQENKRTKVTIFIFKNTTQLVCTSRSDVINDVNILILSISDSDLSQTL